MGAAGLLPVLRTGEIDARTYDVLRRRSRLVERPQDDLEATLRLAVGVGGRIALVGHDRRRARDEHMVADAHGSREADDWLVRRAGGDEAAVHERTSIAVLRALEQVDAWPAENAAAAIVAPGELSFRGDVQRMFQWASVTKLLTAKAVLVAAEEGILDLDEPAGPPGSTVRHLLAHASGLPLDGDIPIARVGERRIYSNTGFERLADRVAERAETSFAEYLHAVLDPLEMRSTRLEGSPAWGAAGTLRDLVAFAETLLRPSVVAPETLAEATQVQFPGLAGVLPGFGRQDPNDWGLGFELRDEKSPHWTGTRNSPRTFGHFGRSGTFLWVDPEAGLACACLTDLPFGDWAREAWPRLSDAVLAERTRPKQQ
jgi:CubicO group peptidase (beta-lactamase class C family)